jgi:exopolysaccharide biosynthesis protein
MDENKIPHRLLNIIITIILIFFIQSIILIDKFNIGKFIFAGTVTYLIYFSVRNTSIKILEEKNSIRINENWFVSEYNLTKEIP